MLFCQSISARHSDSASDTFFRFIRQDKPIDDLEFCLTCMTQSDFSVVQEKIQFVPASHAVLILLSKQESLMKVIARKGIEFDTIRNLVERAKTDETLANICLQCCAIISKSNESFRSKVLDSLIYSFLVSSFSFLGGPLRILSQKIQAEKDEDKIKKHLAGCKEIFEKFDTLFKHLAHDWDHFLPGFGLNDTIIETIRKHVSGYFRIVSNMIRGQAEKFRKEIRKKLPTKEYTELVLKFKQNLEELGKLLTVSNQESLLWFRREMTEIRENVRSYLACLQEQNDFLRQQISICLARLISEKAVLSLLDLEDHVNAQDQLEEPKSEESELVEAADPVADPETESKAEEIEVVEAADRESQGRKRRNRRYVKPRRELTYDFQGVIEEAKRFCSPNSNSKNVLDFTVNEIRNSLLSTRTYPVESSNDFDTSNMLSPEEFEKIAESDPNAPYSRVIYVKDDKNEVNHGKSRAYKNRACITSRNTNGGPKNSDISLILSGRSDNVFFHDLLTLSRKMLKNPESKPVYISELLELVGKLFDQITYGFDPKFKDGHKLLKDYILQKATRMCNRAETYHEWTKCFCLLGNRFSIT